MWSHILSLVLLTLGLLAVSCGQQQPPRMLSGKYGTVLVGGDTVLHESGSLRLYQFSTNEGRRLLWPSVQDPVVEGDLIVFNGPLSNDRAWNYYPAILAYPGAGKVVEFSQSLIALLPAAAREATNYSFTLRSLSNGVITLRAGQRPPVDRQKPIETSVSTTAGELLRWISLAQTNGDLKRFGNIPYIRAK